MKQVSLLRVVSIIIALFVAISCHKEIYCPGFPVDYLEYMPYTAGNTIMFVNENNETLSFQIKNNYSSDAWSFGSNCDCACGADAGFETERGNRYSLVIIGNMHVYDDNNNTFEISCCFYNNFDFSDDFHALDNLSDTIVIEKQEYNRVGKVKIIRGKGIVEFTDSKENCNWVLVEK